MQIKSSEDLSSTFLWLPLLPSAEESQGAGRLSGTLPLRKNSTSSASNISCFQPIPLAARASATVTEGSKEGPTRFSCICDLAQTRSFPSSLHRIWELFKLPQPGLIFVQFKLSRFYHSLKSHNFGEQVDFKKKRTCILYLATSSFLWEALCLFLGVLRLFLFWLRKTELKSVRNTSPSLQQKFLPVTGH